MAALEKSEFADKETFYQFLNIAYNLKPEDIADNFESFHEALERVYGAKHYRIERLIIRTLHERSLRGIYPRDCEMEAFSKLVNVFSDEIQTKVAENRHIANVIERSKKLQNQVNEAQAKLRDAERLAAIGATAGMVGHDIRNPLQSMSGDVYLIRSELESLPEGTSRDSISESLDSLEDNIAYVNKIVQDLQDYARPLKPEYTELNLANLVDELLKTTYVPKNITVSTRLAVPPQIRGEATFLRRVMTNLINNSIQAMPSGGKLGLNAFENGGKLILEISDTGGGIPEEVKSRMFTPMITTKSKGQGFGLAVVKRLIDSLNGTITFESEEGKGTKFTITLPLH